MRKAGMRNVKSLAYPRLEAFEPSAKVGKLRRCDKDHGQFLYNNAGKVKVLTMPAQIRRTGGSRISTPLLFRGSRRTPCKCAPC